MRVLTTVAVVALGMVTLGAQPGVRFRARVEAVRVDVLVTHRNRPVTGLALVDFELRDNGVLQTLDRVDSEEMPLDVLLVLDSSSSGHDRPWGDPGALSYSKRAARAALTALRPGDRAALMFFSHHVSLRAPLTTNREVLIAAIDAARPFGSTALSDALVAAILATSREPGRRTLILAYTDGLENISWMTPSDVMAAARRTDAVVYVVTPRTDARARASARLDQYATMNRFLTDLTTTTGGALIASDSRDLEHTFAQIVRAFTQRYQLAYYPRAVDQSGWHALSVRLTKRRGTVQARRGYHAD